MRTIVLASTSRYRAEILQRLQIPFQVLKPNADETPLANETPAKTALRLAILKAESVVPQFRAAAADTLIIGSDQVAELNGKPVGKPGTIERAFAQLKTMSGKQLVFHTALALIDAKSGRIQSACVATTVQFRDYADDEILHYLAHENALDCAGSAKSEGLGAALMVRMSSDDPTALVGLPLLALIGMLSNEGVSALRPRHAANGS